jgi:twitching motility protein PilT
MKHDIIDLLRMTRDQGGSDLHIMASAPPACRVNGQLQALHEEDLSADACKELILAVLAEYQRATLEKDWEVDFAVQVTNVGRFRGNAHYVRGALEASFRYLPETIPTLEKLGHSPTVNQLCQSRQGLLLVTGMTGQGKTTTLAAMAQLILATRSALIITIEDPIEYMLTHSYGLVKQRQIGQDSHSFSAALRAALRQDPDVIVVSELRDLETISAAITAAETGHLVIGTLHTMDAARTFDRLIDAFPPEQQMQISSQLANCLVGVISQRLIVREDKPGRVLASEVLVANPGISAAIREKRVEQIPGLMQIGGSQGMHTFDDSLTHLLLSGYISFEEAQANVRDRDALKLAFQAHLKQNKQKA